MDNKNNKFLTVTVKGPKNEEFNGVAISVTSTNKKGKFDILPHHASFITLIKDYIIIQQPDHKQITLPLTNGIIKAYEDKVNVLIGV